MCGWTSWRTPRFEGSNLLNYTRIENAHEVRKITFSFLVCIEVQQTFSFHFSLLRHYQIPECFHVSKKLFLSSYNSSIMLQKFVMWPMRSALALISLTRQNKDDCFRSSELLRNTILSLKHV